MRKRLNKKGVFLAENIIFIVLNLAFLTVLTLFIYSRAGGLSLYEEFEAKNIALLIDSARPGMQIYIDTETLIAKAGAEEYDIKEIVQINDNVVKVQLSKDSGYTYSFFNDVKATPVFDEFTKNGFRLVIEENA